MPATAPLLGQPVQRTCGSQVRHGDGLGHRCVVGPLLELDVAHVQDGGHSPEDGLPLLIRDAHTLHGADGALQGERSSALSTAVPQLHTALLAGLLSSSCCWYRQGPAWCCPR